MVQINMSIPESCAECRLSVRHFGKLYCPPLNDRVGNEGKDSRCPLVDAEGGGDLISREDALSCFHDWIDAHGDVHTVDEMPEYQRIEQLPSAEPEHPMVDVAKVTMAMAKKADMVAVTRCKDCKYGAEYPEDKEWPWRCSGVWYDGDGGDQYVRPTSYCSFAERRTDE